MNNSEEQYLSLLTQLIDKGNARMDRTGVGTVALFGREMRFDLNDGFPLFTTKEVKWQTAFKEMLWMLNGGDNIRELLEQGVRIWSRWPLKAYREVTGEEISQEEFEHRVVENKDGFGDQWGYLGPVYGAQWRNWNGIDQVATVLDQLKNDPASRRIIIEGWNVSDLDKMALPPCHKTYQFYVEPNTLKLNVAMIQRSADVFLGLPWNIANLALVCHLFAAQTGYRPGEIIWYGMDVHLYMSHMNQAIEQITRSPHPYPKIIIDEKPSLFDYKIEDIKIYNYRHHEAIPAPVAI